MAEVELVATQVREHWLSHGLLVVPVKSEDLAALRQWRPGIPGDYEAFLRIAGLPSSDDPDGFRFWLPQEVRPTRDVLQDAGYESDESESSVIIADYLQESWWYGLWLTGPFTGCVSLVLGHGRGKDPQPPLGTFMDFLLAYMQDDARLYPEA